MLRKFLIAICIAAIFSTGANAQVIKPQGGHIQYKPIGSWFFERVRYADGTSPCFAFSLSGRTFGHVFTLEEYQDGSETFVFPSFDASFKPKPNEVVNVVIGTQSIEFVHPEKLNHKRFFPVYEKDVKDFFRLIFQREKSGKNYIVVTTSRGGKHQFRIKGVKRAVDFVRNSCSKS